MSQLTSPPTYEIADRITFKALLNLFVKGRLLCGVATLLAHSLLQWNKILANRVESIVNVAYFMHSTKAACYFLNEGKGWGI